MSNFGFESNDLTEFFSAVSVGKKEKKLKKEYIVGESFDELFWNQIQNTKKPEENKKIIKETIIEERKEELKYIEPNFTEPPLSKNSDPLTPLNQDFLTVKEFNKHYKLFLNRIQQQLSTLGGGGEVNLAFMEMPVKYITSSTYTLTPNDYYIGVNYPGAVTITLPTPKKNGKTYIIKDELGEASKGTNRYITILPSNNDKIDGRDRAILAYDFGSLTFIYRNDWRIV